MATGPTFYQPGENLSRYLKKCTRRRGGPHAQRDQNLAIVAVFYCILAARYGRSAADARVPGYLAELDTAMESRARFKAFKAARPRNRKLVKFIGQAMDIAAEEIFPTGIPGAFSIERCSEDEDGDTRKLDPIGPIADNPAYIAAVNDPSFMAQVADMTVNLSRGMARLRPEHRKALKAVAVDGKSFRQAAAMLGKAHTTIQAQYNRAKLLLIRRLVRYRELYKQSMETK